MFLLTIAALAWLALHLLLAGPLRAPVAGRLGEKAFRGLFSALSVLSLAALILAWRAAPWVPLWAPPGWARGLAIAGMLPALLLFAGALIKPNPTAVGGERAMAAGPRGLQRVTRHPMLWSFALWAALHLQARGDLAGLLFFGSLGLVSLAGMPSIDAKLARRDPAAWQAMAAGSAILPFAAILAGRAPFRPAEIGWLTPLLALALWLALLAGHGALFGSPLV
ncbi:NnrU family protein [Roseomonas sp. 18066]|uniref:NnrU family protein n=1 Tax=Roseomonas sp. 18066 TaxID=2681412 RepID=UPI0013598488|nr:NnrU family protein [Roseomonas sp. 18066]